MPATSQNPVCYLDLDGVLVDFVAGAFAVHNKFLKPEEVNWDFWKKMGLTDAEFWAPMGHDFWAGLSWTAEGRELLEGVESIFGDSVVLMTSPCETPGAVEGKFIWIARNLPKYKRRFFIGPAKHLAAGPGKILVDDHDGNVDRFRENGGLAVLVPRPWNRRGDKVFCWLDANSCFRVKHVLADIAAAQADAEVYA